MIAGVSTTMIATASSLWQSNVRPTTGFPEESLYRRGNIQLIKVYIDFIDYSNIIT